MIEENDASVAEVSTEGTPSIEQAPADSEFIPAAIDDERPIASDGLTDLDGEQEEIISTTDEQGRTVRVRRKKRAPKYDAAELQLLGRRSLCKRIADIAPNMGKLVKMRLLSEIVSTRNLDDEALTQIIRKDATKLAEKSRILGAIGAFDEKYDRGQIKLMIVRLILQEEAHTLPENKTDEKVVEYEKSLVKRGKALDFAALKKSDPDRWHQFDTYRIVLEAAWSDDGRISQDEAKLLAVLRGHLSITDEDHWTIGAMLKRFPSEKCVLHTPDEINEARKELQRQGLVWSYGDDANPKIDVIPFEVANVLRAEYGVYDLQSVNYRRLVSHDSVLAGEIRTTLEKYGLDRSGSKADLMERLLASNIRPSEFLANLDKDKLSVMCNGFALKTSGSKGDIIARIIDFYDDLTFEQRISKDLREVWYANYELLAARSHAELRAKKVISKDLEIEHYFEDATGFLFEKRLNVQCDMSRKDTKSDGRLQLDNNQCFLWDCKSAEVAVNLQDYLETQFEGYLNKERDAGKQPIAFFVIAPVFTIHSLKLAHQFKARTNWDVALVQADGLKHLADRWFSIGNGLPFPIRLLNRTEIIDKERAEYLLSLA